MKLENVIFAVRPEVKKAMMQLKTETFIPMRIHAEQFIIDGLRKHNINVEDYRDNGSQRK